MKWHRLTKKDPLTILSELHAKVGKNCLLHPQGKKNCETCGLRKMVKVHISFAMREIKKSPAPKESKEVNQ